MHKGFYIARLSLWAFTIYKLDVSKANFHKIHHFLKQKQIFQGAKKTWGGVLTVTWLSSPAPQMVQDGENIHQ